jgi:hypothetical protein
MHLIVRLHTLRLLFCLRIVLNMGFRTILYQSLFDIGKGSGSIPEVTSCGRLDNCVSVCARMCVCVCVCSAFLITKCSSVESFIVPSVQQKSSGLKFSKSPPGSHVTYSCRHNSSHFTFPISVYSWDSSVFHSLQSITPRVY